MLEKEYRLRGNTLSNSLPDMIEKVIAKSPAAGDPAKRARGH